MNKKCDVSFSGEFPVAMSSIAQQREHYDSTSKIAQCLILSFKQSILSLVKKTGARTLFEVGCGDGHLSFFLAENGYKVAGGDINPVLVEQSNKDASERNRANVGCFEVFDIYSYDFSKIHSDMALCCEVLEHLPDPLEALDRVAEIKTDLFLFSVPSEPLWRIMNMCRLKYLSDFGNTPGHINHWGCSGFRRFIEKRFVILQTAKPVPWLITLCKKR